MQLLRAGSPECQATPSESPALERAWEALGIHPTFHYNLGRVKARFALCYPGFAAVRRLRHLLGKAFPEHGSTTERLIKELREIRRYQIMDLELKEQG